MSEVRIVYADLHYIEGFHDVLSQVAKEKIYIEMVVPPAFEKVKSFQAEIISKNGPVYYAIDDDQVVGWCDVFAIDNPRQSHRGQLGMGLIEGYRGKGLGSQLLQKTLDHCRKTDLEKIELHVYTTNTAAIALYKKFGFKEEGWIKKYRKLDGQYFDCFLMGLDL